MPNRTHARTRTHARVPAPTPARRRGPLAGPAAILAAAVLWGTTGTAATLGPAGAPPAASGSAGVALGGRELQLG
ncbi:hypothetical protein AB0N76_39150, partial [Kitasatospora sp. NPDC093806]